jgi:pimeloyl-ACP methyl ester carboxylesterase
VVSLEGFGVPRTEPLQAPRKYAQWLDQLKSEPTLKNYGSYEALAERLIQNNPRLAPEKARWLAKHWGERLLSGEIRLRADPRHKLPNAVLYRIEEAIACWSNIKCPVLWVRGGESWIERWIAPEELERRRRAFANLREREIGEAGHMLHHDQPEGLAAVIEEFLLPPA